MTFAIVVGTLFGCGVMLIARAFVAPAQVPLSAAMERLHVDGRVRDILAKRRKRDRLADGLVTDHRVKRMLDPLATDLAVAGKTRAGFAADSLLRLFGCVLIGAISGLWFGWLGVDIPLRLLMLAGVVLGFVLVMIGVQELHRQAEQRRNEFLYAITGFVEQVRLGSAFRPLEAAVAASLAVGVSWPFDALRAAVDDATRWRQPIWTGLGDLGRRSGVSELEELASALAMSHNEGSALNKTLTARSNKLRKRSLSAMKGEAEANTAKLQAPVTLLAVVVFLMLLFPTVLRLSS